MLCQVERALRNRLAICFWSRAEGLSDILQRGFSDGERGPYGKGSLKWMLE
jgi:hypothetical protein